MRGFGKATASDLSATVAHVARGCWGCPIPLQKPQLSRCPSGCPGCRTHPMEFICSAVTCSSTCNSLRLTQEMQSLETHWVGCSGRPGFPLLVHLWSLKNKKISMQNTVYDTNHRQNCLSFGAGPNNRWPILEQNINSIQGCPSEKRLKSFS